MAKMKSVIPKPPPELAAAEIIMNPETGAILHAKNADVQRDPASLTKLMTAYIIMQKVARGEMKLDQQITVSKGAAELDNNTFNLKVTNAAGEVETLETLPAGSKLTVREALTVMMTSSANGVAKALGEAAAAPRLNAKGKPVPGTERDFAREMTRVAQEELGMSNSSFINASGLNNGGPEQISNLSTARDMAVLSQRLMKDFPEFEKMVSTHTATTRVVLPDGSKVVTHSPTTNHFVRDFAEKSERAKKEGFYAAGPQKTGFNQLTGGINLLTSAQNADGVRLTSVVLGGRTSDARYAANLKNLRDGFSKLDENPAYAAAYTGNSNKTLLASVSPVSAFNEPAAKGRKPATEIRMAKAKDPSPQGAFRKAAYRPAPAAAPAPFAEIKPIEPADLEALRRLLPEEPAAAPEPSAKPETVRVVYRPPGNE